MTDRIKEIRARCEATTKGPWKATWGLDARAMVLADSDKTFDVRLEGHADAKFIAHSREDIPYLLDQLSERDKEIERLREAVAWIPVTERFPEKANEYMVYDSVNVSTAVWREDTGFYFFLPSGRALDANDYITHWMPFPIKPKGERNADHV